jgi:predicted nuclease of restriction endonuclease-like (RecB) superfamily
MKKPIVGKALVDDLRRLIAEARLSVARTVNSALVGLYWKVGERIHKEILKESRAEYGEQIFYALSRKLSEEFGKGFSQANLFHMVRFAEVFPDPQIVHALSAQLTWTHIRQIIYFDDSLQREFYAEMCRLERWSTRTLQAKIGGMLYERTSLSKKPAALALQEMRALREEDKLSPDMVFRDPYFLNFLGLQDAYHEKDLESAILREMEKFILELGVGFSFVEKQKRITVDNVDYYIDLLFFHRKLHRLVAIDLKLGKFQAADKGQMELYLRWLEKYERQEGEDPPVGLILCAGKSEQHIELLKLNNSGIRVAAYMTELPSRKLLQKKLRQAVNLAQGCLQPKKISAVSEE